MTNPFGYSANVEAPKDVLAGADFSPLATDIYSGTIKQMYFKPTKAGGLAMHINTEINGQRHDFVTYPVSVIKDAAGNPILDAAGKPQQTNQYTNKKSQKQEYLADFLLVDSIVQIAVGVPLGALTPVDLIVEEYDYDVKANVKRPVKGFKEVQGKVLNLAVQRATESKKKQDASGKWFAVAETRQKSKLVKAFDASLLTVLEKANGATEPTYATEWLKKFQGKDLDQTDKSVTAGLPQGGTTDTGTTFGMAMAAGAAVDNSDDFE